MQLLPKNVASAVVVKLGHCPKCMRRSFVLMLGTWASGLAAMLVTNSTLVFSAVLATAVASTGLWLSHLLVFAFRAMTGARTSKGEMMGRNAAADIVFRPRRQFILAFSKTFLLAAAATAFPVGTVLAQTRTQQCLSCCAGRLSGCGNGADCNTEYQNCVANCNSGGQTPADWNCW
jgi:hypothetical protein